MTSRRPRPTDAQRAVLRDTLNRLRSLLLKQSPYLSALIFRPEIRYQHGDSPIRTAATDGRSIVLAEDFFTHAPSVSTPSGDFPGPAAGIFLHELFHIAFGHAARGASMRNRLTRPYNHHLANIAADCIINDTIRSWKPVACALPDDCYSGEKWLPEVRSRLLSKGKPVPDAIGRPTSQTTMEQLHDALVQAFPESSEPCASCGGTGNAPGGNGSSPCPDCAAPPLPPALRRRGSEPIVIPRGAQPHVLDADSDKWKRALRHAARMPGSHPGDEVLDALDFPRVSHPWQKILAAVLSSAIIPRPGYDPLSLARSTIASAAAGLPVFIEPGFTNNSQGATLCVLLDTSGSMWCIPGLLPTLLGHIEAIARLAGVRLHLIGGDTEVAFEQQDIDVDPGLLRSTALKGSGGTVLDPLFERAAELHPNAILCMTDGFLRWPAKPRCPTIWVTAGDRCADASEFPYGKVVNVP